MFDGTTEGNEMADKTRDDKIMDGEKVQEIKQEKDEAKQKQEGEKNIRYTDIYGNRAENSDAYTQEPAKKASFFRLLGLPSLLYAVVYTVCMFQNTSGLTMPIWVAATALYARTVIKSLAAAQSVKGIGTQLKRGSKYYIGGMILLGLSTCLTDNGYLIVGNYIGFFVLLLAFLLHNFYDDEGWGITKYLAEIVAAVFGACWCVLTPFWDGGACYHEKKRRDNRILHAVALGVVCAVPGLFILGALLVSADAVFDSMIGHMISAVRVPMNILQVLLMVLFGFFSSYCGMRFLAVHEQQENQTERTKWEPVTAITFTGLITAMYVVFCGIQVVYLFAGNMRLPEGIGYAEYARSGFFQLLFVCMANFVLVLFVKYFFESHKVLDVLLLLVCICTFIMTASSAYRMLLYISVYQLTFLRVFVLAVLAVLALFMAGAVSVIVRPGFPLFRYCMAIACTGWLFFSFSHVDYFIASYNLSHAGNGSEIDWMYLSGLSMDAAPAISAYQKQASVGMQGQMQKSARLAVKRAERGTGAARDAEVYDSYEAFYEEHWYGMYVYQVYEAQKDMSIRNFNISRYLAGKYLLES